MTYRGRVTAKGVVTLEKATGLATGTEVSVRPLKARARRSPKVTKPDKLTKAGHPHTTAKVAEHLTIWDKLQTLAGRAKGLPADAARNHDHYLYGTPKR